MKKLICYFLIAILTLSFTACAGSGAMTADKFTSVMSKKGYSIDTEIAEDDNGTETLTFVIATKGAIKFIFVEDSSEDGTENLQKLFDAYKDDMVSNAKYYSTT